MLHPLWLPLWNIIKITKNIVTFPNSSSTSTHVHGSEQLRKCIIKTELGIIKVSIHPF